MKLLRKLLFPFSLLYWIITFIRNRLFDRGWVKSQRFELPVICVGNLSTGGTGKSPMTEFLIRSLKEEYRLGMVSRGYKRKTKGYWEVFPNQTAFEVGDEPLQIKRKFPEVVVAVSENRKIGIEKIKPRVDAVLLDDAFQHRKVQPDYSILLTSYGDLYSDDYILPVGNLRESRKGARRAEVVVVTKCPPNLEDQEMDLIQKRLKLKVDQSCYFTKIAYAEKIQSEYSEQSLEYLQNQEVVLVTGIANPAPLVDYLKNKNLNFIHRAFSDHHQFKPWEVHELDKNKCILTTEKDFVRLQPFLRKADLWYLPIAVSFLKDENQFIEDLKKNMKNKIDSLSSLE